MIRNFSISCLVLAFGFIGYSPMLAENYPINFPADATISGSRSVNAVRLSSPLFGLQEVKVTQASDRLLFHDLSKVVMMAAPGETVIPSFDFSGQWMHGYVYLDRGNDGEFAHELGDLSSIPDGSDVMAFSNYDNYNSAGKKTSNQNVGVNPPAFTVPDDLAPGLYRMRYKIDWNSIDPGGNDAQGVKHQQLITDNGGSITDVTLLITDGSRSLNINAPHGSITTSDGSSLTIDAITQGSAVEIRLVPDQSYVLASLTVTSGHDVTVPEGFVLADGVGGKKSIHAVGALITNNTFTIPADMTYGPISITADFRESADEPSEGEYDPTFTGEFDGGFSSVTVNGKQIATVQGQRHSFTDECLAVASGSEVSLSADYSGLATSFALMLDCNNDGVFSTVRGEEIARSTSPEFAPFSLPAGLPAGVYRARLIAEGECESEFLLSHTTGIFSLDADILHGIALAANGTPLPNTVEPGKSLEIKVVPAIEGFESQGISVRHGYNVRGPQYIRGNRQWNEIAVETGEKLTIPAEAVDGDIMIVATFNETAESEWTAIWADEFDGSDLNTDNWQYHPRYGSTWNKRIATGDERPYVNKFVNGHYESYSIATPAEFTNESQNIITGAIYSHNRFYLTGGRIECRLRTRGHSGNFPAFWMMPSKSSYGWPKDGEIDIWEQIDDSFITYHTIHSGWTYKSFGNVSKSSPQSSGSTQADPNLWHVYTLEWDADEYLKWYVDGKLVFTYKNQHWSEGQYTEDITWPFGKAFYVILNQSVGDGSWARDGDPTFEYLTEFDYVRAYQKKDKLNYYTTETGLVTANPEITADVNQLYDGTPEYFNLQGIRIDTSALTPGLYIEKRGTHTRKILID